MLVIVEFGLDLILAIEIQSPEMICRFNDIGICQVSMPGSDQNRRSQKSFSFTVRQLPLVARISGGSTAIIYSASRLLIK